ncbi:1594_t:CDS:2 [Cetraspora pellucida]|uniref:1594_t:CDS:1 n=1 Tax=Cetraspora pellucida TaxID=1433469 RepID=A0ACA9K7S2_9GLOM|nr:1594_t:CDS:2 [Cetraspora pellucida]
MRIFRQKKQYKRPSGVLYFLFLDKRSSLLNEQKRNNESCPYQEERFPNKRAINKREAFQHHLDYKRDLETYSRAYYYERDPDANQNNQKRDSRVDPNYSYKRETTPRNYCRRD